MSVRQKWLLLLIYTAGQHHSLIVMEIPVINQWVKKKKKKKNYLYSMAKLLCLYPYI